MNHLEDVSKNVYFGPKRGKFGPKRPQNGRGYIFFLHDIVSPFDLDDHQKIFRSKSFFDPQNGQNLAIFGQNSHF